MPERPGCLWALFTGSRGPQLADWRPGAQVVAGRRELARQGFAQQPCLFITAWTGADGWAQASHGSGPARPRA